MEQAEGGRFDLETLKLLREVLDEAWERLSPKQRARIQKSDIALRILRHALGGERDPAKVVPMLEVAPGVRAVAIFEELCRRHPEIAVGVRRTLERRIARWRALNGPSRDVIFARSIRRAGWACSEMSRPAFGRSPGRDRSRLLYTTTRRWMRSPQSSGCRKTPRRRACSMHANAWESSSRRTDALTTLWHPKRSIDFQGW
jgi:hypothetical protein